MRLNTFYLLLVLVVTGCSDALPRRSSSAEISESLQLADSASASAAQSAKQAAEERERAEQLLAEVKAFSLRADDAGLKCGEAIKRVSETKAKAQREFKVRRNASAKAATDDGKSGVKGKVGTAEYSASDAP